MRVTNGVKSRRIGRTIQSLKFMEALPFPAPVMPNCPVLRLLSGHKALVGPLWHRKAVVIASGKAGDDVVVNCVLADAEAESVVDEITRRYGKSYGFKTDISRESDAEAMFAGMMRRIGAKTA